MKTRRLIRCGVILAIATLVLSSAVLAGPGQGQGGPPEDPGGVCAAVAALPLPEFVINALGALFCPCIPPECD